jgi:hypothetical protein
MEGNPTKVKVNYAAALASTIKTDSVKPHPGKAPFVNRMHVFMVKKMPPATVQPAAPAMSSANVQPDQDPTGPKLKTGDVFSLHTTPATDDALFTFPWRNSLLQSPTREPTPNMTAASSTSAWFSKGKMVPSTLLNMGHKGGLPLTSRCEGNKAARGLATPPVELPLAPHDSANLPANAYQLVGKSTHPNRKPASTLSPEEFSSFLGLAAKIGKKYSLSGRAYGMHRQETVALLRQNTPHLLGNKNAVLYRHEVLRRCSDRAFKMIVGLNRDCFENLAYSHGYSRSHAEKRPSPYRSARKVTKDLEDFNFRPALIIAEKHANVKPVKLNTVLYLPLKPSALHQAWTPESMVDSGQNNLRTLIPDGDSTQSSLTPPHSRCRSRLFPVVSAKDFEEVSIKPKNVAYAPLPNGDDGHRYISRKWRRDPHRKSNLETRMAEIKRTRLRWRELIEAARASSGRRRYETRDDTPRPEQLVARSRQRHTKLLRALDRAFAIFDEGLPMAAVARAQEARTRMFAEIDPSWDAIIAEELGQHSLQTAETSTSNCHGQRQQSSASGAFSGEPQLVTRGVYG